jgi:hypothetical protein
MWKLRKVQEVVYCTTMMQQIQDNAALFHSKSVHAVINAEDKELGCNLGDMVSQGLDGRLGSLQVVFPGVQGMASCSFSLSGCFL